jgi:hypothetical protein
MRLWGALIAIVMAGCLPVAIVDPATCKVDPALEGTWLAKGLALEQCMHGDVEYGPGAQHSIFLVKAFDERCYLITALDYYLAKDGRLGIFGPGGEGALHQWRGWVAPIGERVYLVCSEIKPEMPKDPDVVTSPGDSFPTFEIRRTGADALMLTPVVFPDILERIGQARSEEEYARRVAEFPPEGIVARIKADPDAAAPGDPGPLTVHRMQGTTEPHVQRVLEAFHIVDPLLRPARFNPPQDDKGT